MSAGSTSPPRPEAGPYSRHLPALDGVRGLAILLVMGSHFFPGTPHNLPERILQRLLAFGATGVDLFFVLSGFLITGILFDSLQESNFFGKFYVRRALRILPLYYGILAIFTIVGVVQHKSSHGELLSLAVYLQNASLIAQPIFSYNGPLFLPLGHFWSLAIEEQFYLVWPLVVFLLRGRRRLLAVCAFFIIICPIVRFIAWQHGAAFFTVHANTLCRADSLLIGGALALLLRSRFHDRVLSVVPWFVGGILFIALTSLVSLSSGRIEHALASIYYSLLAFSYVGLLALSLAWSQGRRFFSLRPLRLLGRYSYGLYVLHLILLGYIEQPMRQTLQQWNWSKGAVVLTVGATGFVVSYAVAVLSYHFYERPFLRLKRYFAYESRPPKTLALVPQASPDNRPAASSALH